MQHADRKSQRRHDSHSEAAIVTSNASDWLLDLRCDLRFAASYVARPLGT